MNHQQLHMFDLMVMHVTMTTSMLGLKAGQRNETGLGDIWESCTSQAAPPIMNHTPELATQHCKSHRDTTTHRTSCRLPRLRHKAVTHTYARTVTMLDIGYVYNLTNICLSCHTYE
jgi:hypothetical protein